MMIIFPAFLFLTFVSITKAEASTGLRGRAGNDMGQQQPQQQRRGLSSIESHPDNNSNCPSVENIFDNEFKPCSREDFDESFTGDCYYYGIYEGDPAFFFYCALVGPEP